MTLVLAANCIDGVVIVADRKITDLITKSLVGYDEKIYGVLRNVIFAYEGAVDMFQVFLRYVAGDVIIQRDAADKYTSSNLLQKLSNVMNILRNIRNEHSKDFRLTIMVARQFPTSAKSDLHIIKSNGSCECVNEWRAIGSGGLTCKEYVIQKWNSNMKMHDFAKLCYCVIKYIENHKLDESVGVDVNRPSIRYLKDSEDIDTEPTVEEFNEFEKSYDTYVTDFEAEKRDT
jgi:20S proteasome alpha/beta subunit